MRTKLKSILTVALAAAIIFGFAIWGTLKRPTRNPSAKGARW